LPVCLNQRPERLTKLDDFGGRVKHFLATAGATVGCQCRRIPPFGGVHPLKALHPSS
jgi:hypothetical protein